MSICSRSDIRDPELQQWLEHMSTGYYDYMGNNLIIKTTHIVCHGARDQIVQALLPAFRHGAWEGAWVQG